MEPTPQPFQRTGFQQLELGKRETRLACLYIAATCLKPGTSEALVQQAGKLERYIRGEQG